MKASDFSCVFLDCKAQELHHPTGRGADGRYLDPDLVVPLSRLQHQLEHTCLRAAGIKETGEGEPNYLRLMRLGHLYIRLGEHHESRHIYLPSTFVLQQGRTLQRIALSLARHEDGLS